MVGAIALEPMMKSKKVGKAHAAMNFSSGAFGDASDGLRVSIGMAAG